MDHHAEKLDLQLSFRISENQIDKQTKPHFFEKLL